jgi:YidC/Oxa1 family membrane protein insertase
MPDVWSLIILNPVLNCLIALSTIVGHNFGLAIIVLTIVVRLILFPLTVKQTQSTKVMQALQPKMQELQKKYGRNQQKLQQETMRLYKEAKINPLGCMWPMLVQFPVWIALYQSITLALASTPEKLLDLSRHLYSWEVVMQAIPLNPYFLGMNLSGTGNIILAVLVGLTMWVQQKMVTPPPTDPRQQSMNQITTLMMPLMFGMFTFSFPIGLALYWAVSNLVGIIMQYIVGGGWGYFKMPSLFKTGGPPRIPPAEQQSKTIREAEKKKGFFKR